MSNMLERHKRQGTSYTEARSIWQRGRRHLVFAGQTKSIAGRNSARRMHTIHVVQKHQTSTSWGGYITHSNKNSSFPSGCLTPFAHDAIDHQCFAFLPSWVPTHVLVLLKFSVKRPRSAIIRIWHLPRRAKSPGRPSGLRH